MTGPGTLEMPAVGLGVDGRMNGLVVRCPFSRSIDPVLV